MSVTTSQISVVGHRRVINPDANTDEIYFPINHPLVRDLLGKVLTIADATITGETQNKAAKDLIRQSVYRWFVTVQENSLTSYRGSIAPIELLFDSDGRSRKYVWHGDGDHAVSVDL